MKAKKTETDHNLKEKIARSRATHDEAKKAAQEVIKQYRGALKQLEKR